MGKEIGETLNTPGDHESLNAGLDTPEDFEVERLEHEHHLENDELFDAPIKAGEVPDLKVDFAVVSDENQALEDMKWLMKSIQSSHGMSQDFALEAERIAPGFLTVPIGYYTKQPSNTRLKVSVENLFVRVWELIKSVIRKVKEIILKFSYWLVGKEYKGEKDPKKVEADVQAAVQEEVRKVDELVVGVQEVANVSTKLSTEVKEGVKFKKSKVGGEAAVSESDVVEEAGPGGERVVQWSDMDRIIDELMGEDKAVKDFMLGFNPYFNDLIMDGTIQATAQSARVSLAPTINELKEKTEAFTLTIQMLVNAPPDQAVEIASPEVVEFLTEPLETESTLEGAHKSMTLVNYETRLRQMLEAGVTRPKKSTPLSFELVFTKLNQSFREATFKDMGRFLHGTATTTALINQYLAEGEKLLDAGVKSHQIETDIDWSKVTSSLTADFTALLGCVAILKKYHTELLAMVGEAIYFGYQVSLKMTDAMASEQNNSNVAMLVKQLRKDCEEIMGRLKPGQQMPRTVKFW